MATYGDLSAPVFVEWFKREVAVPGRFEALYPETDDTLVAGQLVDGLYRARLDGWLGAYEADPDTFEVTPEISLTAGALIVIYGGLKFIQNELKNLPTKTHYEAAGGLVYDVEYAASVMTERLKELAAEKRELLDNARRGALSRPLIMRDGYAIRLRSLYRPEMLTPVLTVTPAELL